MKDYNKLFQISSSYATALFQQSLELKILDAVYNEFSTLIQVLTDPTLNKFFLSNKFNKKVINPFFTTIFQHLEASKLLIQFTTLLITNNKIELLSEIFNKFKRFYLEHQGVVEAVVTVAHNKDIEHMQAILSKLEKELGKHINPLYQIDPELLAGFKLQINSRVIDASLDNTLKKHQKNIIRLMEAL
ncbi:ATP synthase F1 subunit delta [Rickettsiales endosymbiont of Stachyamoeba lipophora]|uniref:ATP synthase F1 subunit delta n=1 Tax=Rickettsiales endosymbiont of Stachyamoeba lipophora TaxID=2486578 RepID=UPI000F6515F6|nr:ATP synthase F1 subunit delta [Rickettsiales endosymbiont of Stachyamoeba lipophora]AZL15690.1 ATP synthase F1 subunit delta [Rickettsiales endosymbiont of Stachyamoeba lipophora]